MAAPIPRAVLVPLLTGAAAVSVAAGVRNALGGSRDLQPYLEGARLWLRGVSPLDVDVPCGFVYLPQAALLFAPLAPLPDPVARGVFAALNVALLIASLAMLTALFSGAERRWTVLGWAAAVGGWAAIRVTVGNGQIGLVVLAAVLAALLADRRGRTVLAGLALALALTKWSLSAPLLVYFAARRRWAPLWVALGAVGAGYVAFGLRLGQGPWAVVHDYAMVLRHHAGIKGAFLRTTELTAAADAVAGPAGYLLVLAALITALLATGWACAAMGDRRGWALLLGVCATVSLVALPHLHYDELILVLALPALLLAEPRDGLPGRVARGLGAVTCALLWLDVPGTLWKLAGRPAPIPGGGAVYWAYLAFDRVWLALLLAALLGMVAAAWLRRRQTAAAGSPPSPASPGTS